MFGQTYAGVVKFECYVGQKIVYTTTCFVERLSSGNVLIFESPDDHSSLTHVKNALRNDGDGNVDWKGGRGALGSLLDPSDSC